MKIPLFRLPVIILIFTFFITNLLAQNVVINEPLENQQFDIPTIVEIQADVASVIPGEPINLKVINNQTGYRKLKFGYNQTSLYSPKINVIGAGNDKIEITLKDLSGTADWSKIRLRPESKGSLNLSSYIQNAGGYTGDWISIEIPLSDFDPAINFSSISYFEFPYSANADFFELAISEIKFIGSNTPVEWFGANHHDNLHDGSGIPGGLIATLEPGTEAVSNVQKVEFYANDQLLGEDLSFPFSFVMEISDADDYTLSSRVIYDDDSYDISLPVNIIAVEPLVFDLAISINCLQENTQVESPANIFLEAAVVGSQPKPQTYMHVSNELSGYRKLKFGYNSTSIYSPAVNPVASGNDTLEIVLKDNMGTTNWSRIRIRPSAAGSLNLFEYIQQAGGAGTGLTKLKIPLSDFDPGIDFSNIAFFEFPYSADAGNFDLEIYSMIFTGGSEDFIWFGKGKTDNAQNGTGAPGELVAELVIPAPIENTIDHVAFYSADQLIQEIYYPPFSLNLSIQEEGICEFTAMVSNSNGQTATSNAVHVEVIPPAIVQSALTIHTISPANLITLPAPAQINFETKVSGIVQPQPAHLLVSNAQTGYRKLKFGNNPNSIYSPKIDLIAGGNTHVEITLQKFCPQVNWQKIRMRPQAKGTLNLKAYVDASGSDLSEWTTISIPLADFDPGIDFSNIAFFEFPYSADAGTFEIGIRKVEFTGGPNPVLWFGDDKMDNAHNGNGGGGELIASLQEATQESIDVAMVEFYLDGEKMGQIDSEPFSLDLILSEPGSHLLNAVLTDTENLQVFTDTSEIIIEELSPDQGIFITIQFDEVPQNISVGKASLKYDKDFAYSFALDDGKIDAYTYAFQLLNGGYIEANSSSYSGLYYTDGCGNDIPFKGALAWNSVNRTYSDLHVNTPDYVTWIQMVEMYDAGWDVLNHSYSHAAWENTNYEFEITQNRDYVYQKTGIEMNHFVVPSGDNSYIQPAFDLGNKVVHTRTDSYLGYSDGLPIDNPINFDELRIYRKMIYDDLFTIANVSRYLDDVADNSVEGEHYWWSEFTHRVRYEQTGASLEFPTFEFYMNYIEQTYGKSGSDRIWMAPVQEVYEYLLARDQSQLSWVLDGTQLTILLNVDDLPVDLRNYELTLALDTDLPFVDVQITGGDIISFNGEGNKKLINLKWNGSPDFKSGEVQAETTPTPAIYEETCETILYPNPVSGSSFTILNHCTESCTGNIQIMDAYGKMAKTMNIHFLEGKNELTIPTEGLQSGIYFVRIILPAKDIIIKKISLQN